MIGVGRCLDHRADIVRDHDTAARPQPFDGLAHRQRIVDPRPAMTTLRLAVFRDAGVPWAGLQHDGDGVSADPMAVQPTKPLQQRTPNAVETGAAAGLSLRRPEPFATA